MTFEQEIIKYLFSQNHLILIKTSEEERLEYITNRISQKIFKNHLYVWDFIKGYKNYPGNAIAQRDPIEALNVIEKIDHNIYKIFFLKDFNDFTNDFTVIRKLKNLSEILKQANSFLIISSTNNKIPETLSSYITILNFPLPNQKEIKEEIERLVNLLQINHINYNSLITAYQGFSIDQIRKSMIQITSSETLKKNIIQNILQEKEKIIEQTEILEFYQSRYTLSDIGGFNNLKMWLKKRSFAFSEEAQHYGIPTPKGLLLIGIQGTGKSLSAKAISSAWNLPLLKLDIGKIFAGLVGESENRMRKMLLLAEQMSPCILWIDEIDKIFNKNIANNDSGTTNRVMNGIISWLSEKKSSVFVVATANNISNMPIEMLRKGRFDEIFFLNLPNFEGRLHIFQIHLKRIRPLSWNQYNIYYLSKISYNFSGAEIEQAIINAMYNAFYESREFTTQDIATSIQQIVPLAFLDESQINKIQEIAYSGKIMMA
uniref:Uncharacterized AAA domain-containing protein ycf46 n=1 Tax=Anotrichium furcellatum TaxID=41999 RepID=A0A4D6WL10_9FLOR|nr:hypothetical protein [Anotrichium furcellatum]